MFKAFKRSSIHKILTKIEYLPKNILKSNDVKFTPVSNNFH